CARSLPGVTYFDYW
nr:immunoglobulin heavy chain junction region [Mus musculus]